MKRILFVLLFCACAGAAAGESATVLRDTALRQDPATDAETVTMLQANDRVETLGRRGGWTKVRTSFGETGWVKLLTLRYGGERRGSTGLGSLFRAARTGSSGTVVTTGVRGLDDESLANSTPDPAEVKKLDGYAASADAARRFASSAGLKAHSIPYPQAGQ